MAKVRILPDRVANQIAAGEVIERPAAVIKELVENALDAGATRIEVEFRSGGRALMRVDDNGSGMGRDDALLALERHATSKISEADDLNRLMSYGFRGEALPSIASVSRFLLQTRTTQDDVGTEIMVNGGRMIHVRDCGRPIGTRIDVTQLFNSVPARRKFLKTDQTEAAHIVQCVRLYALARPEVAFSLIEDGRTIFRSPECADFSDRVAEIFGRQVSDTLVTLDVVEGAARLRGLIGRPGIGRATRHEMITFVNRRPVDSRTLNYAMIESYHESLPKGRFPVAFLFFEIEPSSVDVNVHPAKREVRFRSESAVRSFVIRAILQRLRELGTPAEPVTAAATQATSSVASFLPPPGITGSVPDSRLTSAPGRDGGLAPNIIPIPAPLPPQARSPETARGSWGLPGVPETGERVVNSGARGATNAAFRAAGDGAGVQARVRFDAPPADGGSARYPLPAWRYVGLAHGAYALFETSAGLVLLDRRAAHERTWFERLQSQFRAGDVPSQRLLLPVPIELDPIASALLTDRLAFLNSHGFEIAEFGRNFFRIEAIPVWMEPADSEPFVRDLIGAARDGRLQDKDQNLAREELARIAASRAVRLPSAPTEADMTGLVAQLFSTRAPLTSPMGKPTYIELNHGELSRRFQK